MASTTADSPNFNMSHISIAVLGAFFVSGACGLIHEVAWTRLLRLIMGLESPDRGEVVFLSWQPSSRTNACWSTARAGTLW